VRLILGSINFDGSGVPQKTRSGFRNLGFLETLSRDRSCSCCDSNQFKRITWQGRFPFSLFPYDGPYPKIPFLTCRDSEKSISDMKSIWSFRALYHLKALDHPISVVYNEIHQKINCVAHLAPYLISRIRIAQADDGIYSIAVQILLQNAIRGPVNHKAYHQCVSEMKTTQGTPNSSYQTSWKLRWEVDS